MKKYSNPYDMINDSWSGILDVLTEEEQDFLRHVLDYEAMSLVVHDGVVDLVDDISGEIYNTQTITAFIHDSIKYAMIDSE